MMAMKPEDDAEGDRRRPRHRDLRAHHDDVARVAHDRPGRSLGRLRRLHGRRLVAGPRPGPRLPGPPCGRLRRRRLAADAARLAGHDRRGRAAQPHAPALQERRLPHLRLAGDAGRAERSTSWMAKGAGYRKLTPSPSSTDFKHACPRFLTDEGPILVELHTGLAEQTPMTAAAACRSTSRWPSCARR